jgi:hypothetical protein
MKKGIQSQFTWIFILIAGVVILSFFISISYRQQAASEQRISIELEQGLDSIISAALQSPGTSLPVPTPAPGVAFRCTRTCDCSLAVGSSPKATSFGEKIYFTPDFIDGADMTLWTLPWTVPFRATNFLYITNSDVKYYFITTSSTQSQSLRDELLEILPTNLTIEFRDVGEVSDIEDAGHAQTRFIFLRSGKSILHPSFDNNQVRGVELIGDTLQFLFKDEGLSAFELIDDAVPMRTDDIPALLGATFAHDRTMYTCGMQHAYTKLGLVAQVFKERSLKLDGFENRCFYAGPAGAGPFEDMQTAAETLELTPTNAASVGQLNTLTETFNRLNTDKIQDGCPALY